MTAPKSSDPRDLAAYHVAEAERLLKSWWISSHVQAQAHATLAVYYAEQAGRDVPVAAP